ncbi:MAG: hypothetical protein ABJB86_15335 [Bacteroidota bacterium]
MSFYYWKTNFHLDSIEKETITNNSVNVIYIRYFDVDFLPGDSIPTAIMPVSFDTNALMTGVVPVVYVKNRTLERLDSTGLKRLSEKAYSLVTGINQRGNVHPAEIQFDCDWTETTKDKYFLFLKQYKLLSNQIISATIRLHQIKYPGITGIPPVDYGVLMYYNMGDINSGTTSSIYDKAIATKYAPSIKTYPLTLDIALPIFSWSLQVRDGRVVKLLNKMNFQHFENDSNFISAGKDRYTVKHACFHGGYYFKENDTIKTEHVTEADLMDIVMQVNRYSNNRIRNLIFYDLDKENLVLYDKNIFRKILDHTD